MKIQTGVCGEWNYYYLEEFGHLLAPVAGEFTTLFAKHLKACTKLGDYRIQLSISGTPFLVAFLSSKKSVRFYSPRMGAELFALKSFPIQVVNEKFRDLKEHVDVSGQLLTHKTPTVSEMVTEWNSLPELTNEKYQTVFKKSDVLVQKLLQFVHGHRPSLFERLSDYGLSLTAQFSLLRIHLLKFLAILPSLDHDKKGHEVKRILLESLRRLLEDSGKARGQRKKGSNRALPSALRSFFGVVHQIVKIFPAGALAIGVRFCVRMMAKRFIAGESIEKTEKSLKNIFKSKRDVTLDQLGELVVSEKEADHYCAQVLKLILGLSQHITKGEKNEARILRAHVSIKVSALSSDFKPQAYEYTYAAVAPRLRTLLITAKKEKVFINIDAEHYHYRDLVLKIYAQVLLETPELKDYADTGIVLQAYLRDGYDHLEDIIALSKKRGMTMPIRIVKGAYWDAETVEGDANNFDAPQFLNKEETDLHFNQLVVKILENYPHVQICLASHNFTDHCFAETLRTEHFPNIPPIEHQCLHMTYEALSLAMAQMGWVVRNYVPVGPLIVGMAYLVRRIMENSSQVGVLTIMRSHKRIGALTPPWKIHQEQKSKGTLKRDLSVEDLSARFINITPVRLYVEKDLLALQKIFSGFTQKLNQFYKNLFLLEGKNVSIISSSDPTIKVGEITFANQSDATKAIAISAKNYAEGPWSKLPWYERTHCLNKAAILMLMKRLNLAALISYEAGKTALEALGDVDEAIDFLNFYAREEAKFYQRNSKHKDADILSRGPIAVIAPWNFPLAIPCGMVVGALVTGNTVILKSAEQTPLIAQALVDLLHEAGVPSESLIHLPGEGSEVGQVLVDSNDLAGYIFTGSKVVGQMIYEKAASRVYKNPLTQKVQPVRVITEMGGKNAIIVTGNAELDETVSGIMYSSYGHAGQKCSAASRVIVSNKIKDKLIERLKEATMDLNVGRAFDFSTMVNPLIAAADKKRVQDQVKIASKEKNAIVVIDRSGEDLPGNCVGPVVIEVTKELAFDANSFAQKELFAPVLHVMGYDSLEEAIDIFNVTEYALTGGIFSQSQDDIDYLSSHLECGNLYINRSITGARVAIEPFGGFKLSGTGPKAGGKSYLPALHFLSNSYPVASAKNESGVDYQFPRCSASKLSAPRRMNKMSDAFSLLIKNFEVLFPGIYGEEKEVLAHFKKWINDEYLDFKNGVHPNRKIPGQLSYNDYRLHSKSALVIGETERPDITTLIKVSSALLVGMGVTVAARNQSNFEWWDKVKTFMHNGGISKENFDVFFASEKVLNLALEDVQYTHVIFDSLDSKYFPQIKNMTKKITPHEAPKLMDFKKFLEDFVWTRSFAVNTMRHGAPLEIDVV